MLRGAPARNAIQPQRPSHPSGEHPCFRAMIVRGSAASCGVDCRSTPRNARSSLVLNLVHPPKCLRMTQLVLSHPQRLVLYCRTTSANTAPCTSRRVCCPTHCASYCAVDHAACARTGYDPHIETRTLSIRTSPSTRAPSRLHPRTSTLTPQPPTINYHNNTITPTPSQLNPHTSTPDHQLSHPHHHT